MDKISVIVPVYNVQPYLEKCLSSIVEQTYQNLEIVCVDDGSTDDSGKILDTYARHDGRIKVIHQKNAGASSARNTGLDNSTGDWITFVDSDDWLDKDMYECMLMKSGGKADIYACGYSFSYSDHEAVAENRYPVPAGVQDIRPFLFYIYCRDDYKGVGSYIWNKLFRADWFNGKTAKLRFDVTLGSLGDDIDLAAKCFVLADTIAYIPDPKYHYVQRGGSAFVDSIDKRLETLAHIRAYENIISLYEKENIDGNVMRYLERFYVYHLGVLMERALETGNKEKIEILKEKAAPYMNSYYQTNIQYPDRIEWVKALFGESHGSFEN